MVKAGTAATASSLKHPLGGKTGTTNDFTDAWFIGFSPSITCGTWIGFDDRQSLGSKETGAKAALPMWMDFMKAAIADKPNETFPNATAPKKVLEVPMTPDDDAPAVKTKPAVDPDADPDGDDADAPSASPKAPARVPTPDVPSAPATAPRARLWCDRLLRQPGRSRPVRSLRRASVPGSRTRRPTRISSVTSE